MIQNTNHHLSLEMVRFLNRGPTYVIPCQMHLVSSLDQILTKQIMPLRRQLTKLFTKYPVDLTRRCTFEKKIEEQFIKSFFQPPIPVAIEQRAFHEKQLLRSIQIQLKSDQLILRRTADNNNTYYLGCRQEFEKMTQDHLDNSHYCEIIGTINELHSEKQYLIEIIQSIDSKIEQLVQKKLVPIDHLKKLQIGKRTNIKLPHLYFLPKSQQNGQVLLQPRLSSCKNAPIQILATFLDQLIRSLFEKFSQVTTFLNGHDFLQKIRHYSMQMYCFTSTTKFVTFQIHHLYHRVPHADLLTALNRFLVNQLVIHRHQRFTIDTIEELTALFLHHHIFTYQGKIYRYIKGSPLNFTFTQLLMDIYLQNWQLSLVRQIRINNKFYGRYHDMGIFTWDGSNYALQTCLLELNEQYPDVQITTSTGAHVHFLNVYIENKNGSLYTRVYHDPMKQPFLLPYTQDHPRLIHRQWFRFAFMRAGQYCSSFDDFQDERLYIELTFLANGYSLDFIHYHSKQFLKRFNSIQQQQQQAPIVVINRSIYLLFRQQLFSHMNQQKMDSNNQQQQQIQLYYLFDWGARCEFNQKFYELWSSILLKDPSFAKFGLQIRLHSKHCYLSNSLLVQ